MAVEIPKCACGCGAVLKRVGKTGPAPTYASASCRVRAYRRRQSSIELTPFDPDAAPAPVQLPTTSTDNQVARSLLEARAVGFAFVRLGHEARPELAWRCETLGTTILTAIQTSFPETER